MDIKPPLMISLRQQNKALIRSSMLAQFLWVALFALFFLVIPTDQASANNRKPLNWSLWTNPSYKINNDKRLSWQTRQAAKRFIQNHRGLCARFWAGYSPQKRLKTLACTSNDFLNVMNVIKTGAYKTKRIPITQVRRRHVVRITLRHSLHRDGRKAGLSSDTIHAIEKLFSWHIDLARHAHVGDKLVIIKTQYQWDNWPPTPYTLDSVKLKHHKSRWHAFWDDKQGRYIDAYGAAFTPLHLRYPVKFKRISSPFRPKRMHPILGFRRPHWGIDYAAPPGNPIWTTASGRVVWVGTKGGYGKTVIIEHANGYTTLYAHMSRYARYLKVGQAVYQGQVIGYVGQTGLATGPHVHYEVRYKGKPIDPAQLSTVKNRTTRSYKDKMHMKTWIKLRLRWMVG